VNQASWGIDVVNAYGNGVNFNPPADMPQVMNERTIDPRLGSCLVFIPDDSPMKRAGKGGADIGANVLYRYHNGMLTPEPLWNPATGQFPCGALVDGVNNLPGESCFDVHVRLHVQAGGCDLPNGYGFGGNWGGTPPRLPAPRKFRLVIRP
jgi:hypothetical protein